MSRSSARVMVIRHPFTRLVSAFNHRWGLCDENDDNTTSNYALAQKIINHTQPGSNNTLLRFPDFVRFLINRGNEFKELKKEVKEEQWSSLASHWQPFSSNCDPCKLLPHIVLELENLSEELPFVLEWSGLVRVYGRPAEVARPRDRRSSIAKDFHR